MNRLMQSLHSTRVVENDDGKVVKKNADYSRSLSTNKRMVRGRGGEFQGDASWCVGETDDFHIRNVPVTVTVEQYLRTNKEVLSLLELLQTNDFSGRIDPLYHSQYLKEPETVLTSSNTKQS